MRIVKTNMYRLVVIGIVFLAFILRTTSLDGYPRGFTPDEASFGYDAYSIFLTGKDQWGESFPLVLKSFGDYKAPLYSYISIPFVATLGLNRFAVRLPNALFGVLAVVATYLLAGELSKIAKFDKRKVRITQLVSSLLIAISPWHTMMSRGAFEANLTTFLLPMGIYFFLRARDDINNLNYSAIFFALNLFSYHSAQWVTPMVILFLVLLFYKDIKKYDLKKFYFPIVLIMVSGLLMIHTMYQSGGPRAVESIISQGATEEAATNRLIALESGEPFFVSKAIHNKYTVTLKRFISNYSQYTSYEFLYLNGPAEGTYGMLPGYGVSYWFTFPLIIFFFYYLIRYPKNKASLLLLFWLIAAPIPAALASGAGFSANRAVIMLPGLQLVYAFGFVVLYEFLKKWMNPLLFKISLYGLAVVALLFFLNFVEKYFVISPYYIADDMLYGNLEAAYIASTQIEEDMIVSKSLSEPHIYFAFIEKMDPNEYQKYTSEWDLQRHGVSWVDQIPEYKLGRYIFKTIEWNKDSITNNWFIGRPEDFPSAVQPEILIRYPNKQPAVYIVDSRFESYAHNSN